MPPSADPPIHTYTRDVVVIGGGPAGSSTAMGLARKGYFVILLDRARFPRDKVCGDYLTPGAVRLLRDEIGILPQLLAAGAVPVTEQRVVAHDGRAFTGTTGGMSCPRSITDALLLGAASAAGVDVREGFSVRDILIEGNVVVGVRGDDEHGDSVDVRARITVGADGTHSLLARRLGVVRPIRRLQQIALSAYCNGRAETSPPESPHPRPLSLFARSSQGEGCPIIVGQTNEPEAFDPQRWIRSMQTTIRCGGGDGLTKARSTTDSGSGSSGAVTMYQPSNRSHGCCGVGPTCGPDERSNVNIVVPCSEAAFIAGRKREYLAERLAGAFPAAYERLRDLSRVTRVRSIGCFGHHTSRAAHDGALLVGDAATFIDPFTGEGVYFALEGARLAAIAIDRALQAGDIGYQQLRSYDEARRRVLLPRYRLCGIVQRVAHSPRLLSWASTRLHRSPTLADAVLRAVGDVDMPGDLVSWENLAELCTQKTQP
jgi:flavin-dependent dehydrogenase